MSRALTLVSLNVERSKHLNLVLPFLERSRADVVCVQELAMRDVSTIREATGAQDEIVFDMSSMFGDGSDPRFGVGIFSRHPFVSSGSTIYADADQRVVRPGEVATFNNIRRSLVYADIQVGESAFRFGTTHFTWSPAGQATDLQRTHMRALLSELEEAGELVFTGDFNAPRGGEIWNMLASRYKDNVPLQYKTSLDPDLHRAKDTHPEQLVDKMVDGIFSTPAYRVSDVRMVCGVSDHCALVGNVTLA